MTQQWPERPLTTSMLAAIFAGLFLTFAFLYGGIMILILRRPAAPPVQQEAATAKQRAEDMLEIYLLKQRLRENGLSDDVGRADARPDEPKPEVEHDP